MEPREVKIKRLAMRSMRRGIKEMDLILSAFAEKNLSALADEDLSLYDQLLSENDHDLYNWVSGQSSAPEAYGNLMAEITKGAHGLTRPN
ncbi:antitoxin CptB [Cognatiyoonia sediminum]|uniref:FAD assembly factor SdhE n=2 Tax=Cognatiyoonia sediminum TaxID=1508389 RepID=A0A1M5L1N7_9RHOB|nr:succinate dehydrogenase assembly factor 2 [Cognatiyoonia sediminum]SHG58840.1 antitoxin CptB [Cognatiyoonia sediminum]